MPSPYKTLWNLNIGIPELEHMGDVGYVKGMMSIFSNTLEQWTFIDHFIALILREKPCISNKVILGRKIQIETRTQKETHQDSRIQELQIIKTWEKDILKHSSVTLRTI